MAWRAGDLLRHRTLDALGVGEVVSVEGPKLRVRFDDGEERVFLTSAPVEPVDRAAAPGHLVPPASRSSSGAAPAGDHTPRLIAEARSRCAARSADAPLELPSPRGRRVDLRGPCSRCERLERPLWFYPESSLGPVYLCTPCKDRERDPGDRPRDVLDLSPRKLSRSAFETRRSRH